MPVRKRRRGSRYLFVLGTALVGATAVLVALAYLISFPTVRSALHIAVVGIFGGVIALGGWWQERVATRAMLREDDDAHQRTAAAEAEAERLKARVVQQDEQLTRERSLVARVQRARRAERAWAQERRVRSPTSSSASSRRGRPCLSDGPPGGTLRPASR